MGCTTQRLLPTSALKSEQDHSNNKAVDISILNQDNATTVHKNNTSGVENDLNRFDVTQKQRHSISSNRSVENRRYTQTRSNTALIWLNSQLPSESNLSPLQADIKNIFSELDISNDVNGTMSQMSRMTNANIFIVICGPLPNENMSTIIEMPQVQFIYLCSSDMQHSELYRLRKIKGIYDNSDTLAQDIHADMARFQTITDSITIFDPPRKGTSTRDLHTDKAWFISFHYLLEIIFHLPESDDEQAKAAMIDRCRAAYRGNTGEEKDIEEFEKDYTAGKALRWYTRESFLYRSLNKSLRSNETMDILTFRFIIKHIHQEIVELQKEQSESQLKNEIIVYRGQFMHINEANNLKSKINSLISINTFFSASTNRQVASQFLGNRSQSDYQSVLFTIHLKVSSGSKPFAHISAISYFPDEDEVLLSLGSVFRIDEAIMTENNILNIRMTLSTEEDEDIKEVISYLSAQIGDSSSLLTFGGFLLNRGEFENVIKFCEMMNIILPYNHPDLADVYNNWGGTYYYRGDYRTALDYYKVAYDINQLHLETISTNSIATTESRIGEIYYKMGDPSTAISYFQHARAVLESEKTDYAHIVKLYSQIGLAYADYGDNQSARDYVNNAIRVASEKRIPAMHSSYAWLKMSEAMVPKKTLNNREKLTTLFQEALQAFQDSLPKNHPDLIIVQLNFGDFYQSYGEYKLALKHFNDALDMCKQSLIPDHPDQRICQLRIKLAERNK